jgi:hypothetical protein
MKNPDFFLKDMKVERRLLGRRKEANERGKQEQERVMGGIDMIKVNYICVCVCVYVCVCVCMKVP